MASDNHGLDKEIFLETNSSNDDTGLKKDTLARDISSVDFAEDSEKYSTERISTNESAREPHFEPINAGDRGELTRLASQIAQSPSYPTSLKEKHSVLSLRRKDTLDGVTYGDDVLDPNSKDFDVYKWYPVAVRFVEITS